MNHCECAQDLEDIAAGGLTDGTMICGRCFLEKMPLNHAPEAAVVSADVSDPQFEKDVYLALKGSQKFKKGIEARNKLQSIIKKREAAKALRGRFGIDPALACPRKLYDAGAFHSEAKAIEMFPELFEQQPNTVGSAGLGADEPVYLGSMALKKAHGGARDDTRAHVLRVHQRESARDC